jgi:DNA-binding CsgD family transcriptional regulator
MSVVIEVAGSAAKAPPLSPSEKICLQMVAEGRALPDIGAALQKSEAQVEIMLSSAEEKLGAHNRLHAVSLAMLRGHLDYRNAKPD